MKTILVYTDVFTVLFFTVYTPEKPCHMTIHAGTTADMCR